MSHIAGGHRPPLQFEGGGLALKCRQYCSSAAPFAIIICLVRLEDIFVQNRLDEVKQLLPDILSQIRIPDGVCHHQAAEGEEGRNNLKHVYIAGVIDVALPESPEQRLEISIKTAG